MRELAKFKISKLNKSHKIKNNSIAQILFTSGSTGKPKRSCFNTQVYDLKLVWNSQIFINRKNKPRFLSVTPLYHNNGQFIPTLLPFILNGSTISISPDTSLINFWPTCLKYKINYSSVMATHINYFNNQKKKYKITN